MEATLQDIKVLARRLYERNRALRSIILQELYRIARAIATKPGMCDDKFHSLTELLDDRVECKTWVGTDNEDFKRNLLAHAGLERCVTLIRCPQELQNELSSIEDIERRVKHILEEHAYRIMFKYDENYLNVVADVVASLLRE